MSRRGALVVCLTAAVLGLGVAGVSWYAFRAPQQTRDVAQPKRDATPEQVARAYLDALSAHDCRTAEAVVVPTSVDSTARWCHDLAHLTDVQVHSHIVEDPKDSGFPRSGTEQVVDVPVDFNIDWRTFHDDLSLSQGAHGWEYLLVRTSNDQPWRIFDQGTG